MTFRFSEIEAQLSKTNTQVKQQQDRLVTDNVHLCLEKTPLFNVRQKD